MKKLFIILALLSGAGYAQDCEGEWQFTEDYFNEHLVAYYLNAIDIDTGEQNFELFRYWVHTDAPSPHNFEFFFSIEIYSPQLGFPDYETFGSMLVDVIPEPGVTELHVRNTDISGDTQVQGAIVEILEEWDSLDLSLEDYAAFSSVIMQSGRLPNGIYRFTSTITDWQGVPCSFVQNLEVYEPEFIELITPGGELDMLNDTVIHTTYPVFSWNADYCAEIDGISKCDLGIRVCEYRPEIHSSLEDAMNDMAHLPLNQDEDFLQLEGNARVMQYPTTAAMDLQPGHMYAWQLQREFITTQGDESMLSDIYVFRIESTTASTLNLDMAMDMLKELLGEDRYKELFGPGGELEGYTINGDAFVLNGRDVPLDQLNSTLNGVSTGGMELINSGVE